MLVTDNEDEIYGVKLVSFVSIMLVLTIFAIHILSLLAWSSGVNLQKMSQNLYFVTNIPANLLLKKLKLSETSWEMEA